MPRPRRRRRIRFCPRASYFKPVGIPLRMLDVVYLTFEEGEVLRLKHQKGLNQTQGAKEMKTSQSTFQRILRSAYQKIAIAVVEGKAIRFTETDN